MFYSPTLNGFYTREIHGDNIPEDAVEITNDEHDTLLAEQSAGKVIEWSEDLKKPITADRSLTTDEILEMNRSLKKEALDTIVVETSSGKSFDGNETARSNMMAAIMSADMIGQTTAVWKLADNTVAEVTVAEVREALALAIQRVGEIVTA